MRFVKTILLLSCLCFVFSSCGGEKDLGNDYLPGQDAQYMYQAQSTNTTMATTENGYYFLIGNYIYYADKDKMEPRILCNKPDCLHEKEMDPQNVLSCNAFVSSGLSPQGFLTLYKDRLYVLSGYDNAQQKEQPQITSISLDGTNRKTEFLLPRETSSMTLHRGYFYYVQTDFSDGSISSSRIMRHKLGKSQTQEECIFTSEIPGGKIQDLFCRGNQLYFKERGDLEDKFVLRTYLFDILSGDVKRIFTQDDNYNPSIPKIVGDRLYVRISNIQNGESGTDAKYFSTDLQANDMKEEFSDIDIFAPCMDEQFLYGNFDGYESEDKPENARIDIYDHSGNLKDSVEIPGANWALSFAPGDDQYIFLQYDDDTYTYVDLIDKKEIGSKNIKPISFFKMETSYINKGVLVKAS